MGQAPPHGDQHPFPALGAAADLEGCWGRSRKTPRATAAVLVNPGPPSPWRQGPSCDNRVPHGSHMLVPQGTGLYSRPVLSLAAFTRVGQRDPRSSPESAGASPSGRGHPSEPGTHVSKGSGANVQKHRLGGGAMPHSPIQVVGRPLMDR